MKVEVKVKREFDDNVKVGELRIFADVERPVVALIAEDRGVFGFRVIPVAEFTNVSCEGEQLVGDRVYQHWNACNVPRSFAVRSWLVATLSSSEFSVICSSASSTSTSSLHLSSYQRTYLFSVPDPLARDEEKLFHRSSSLFTLTSSFRKVAVFALAACLVLALVFAIRLDLDRASHKEEKAHAWNLVLAPKEPEALQASVDEPVKDEQVEIAGNVPKFEIAPPADAQIAREPEISKRVSSPKMAKVEPASTKAEAELDKVDVAVMRELPRKSTIEHAIAVMTYLACGVSTGHGEFGPKLVESTERLVESVMSGKTTGEYTRRLVATALCHAYVASSNPELKPPAETALDLLGDKRAVDIVARGYDLVDDWYASREAAAADTPGTVARPVVRPDWLRFLHSRSWTSPVSSGR